MTDQRPDIDIEAERTARRGWEWHNWDNYWPAVTAARFAWEARARLAAEREREMVDLLREAQREGCTRCYSDAVGLPCCYPHSAQCLRITAALKKGPSDER